MRCTLSGMGGGFGTAVLEPAAFLEAFKVMVLLFGSRKSGGSWSCDILSRAVDRVFVLIAADAFFNARQELVEFDIIIFFSRQEGITTNPDNCNVTF